MSHESDLEALRAQAIAEADGWALDQWSVNVDSGGTFNAFPLFRRRDHVVPQDRT